MDTVTSRILNACTCSSERSYLHSLGALLAIQEWLHDFRQHRFSSADDFAERKSIQVKKKRQVTQISTKEEKPTVKNAEEEIVPLVSEQSVGHEEQQGSWLFSFAFIN